MNLQTSWPKKILPMSRGTSVPVKCAQVARIPIILSENLNYFAIVEIFQEALTVVSMVSTFGIDILKKSQTHSGNTVFWSVMLTQESKNFKNGNKKVEKQAGAELCLALAKLSLPDSWGKLTESCIKLWV